jgi:VIT1/CCC1 family predicted Fe2+/Mn2+ transporter/rubrerythrin
MAQVEQEVDINPIVQKNWLSEMQCIGTYARLLENEKQADLRTVLRRLVQTEEKHKRLWENMLTESGTPKPSTAELPQIIDKLLATPGGNRAVFKAIEEEERLDVAEYTRQLREIKNERLASVLREVIPDEHAHALILRRLQTQPDARSALDRVLRRQRQGAGGWIGDAVYGVNDGLGAIFGIVSGVSGATLGDKNAVLLAGLAGMIASALSMGAGAYLAAKSERELYDAELFYEKKELELHPGDAKEEMSLFYQLKGVPEAEADSITESLAQNEDQFLKSLAAEKLNLTEDALSQPITSAVIGSVSTAVGAFIPIIPFFFIGGLEAVEIAAVISLIAHFLVGAGKSLVTVRSWWASGFEMTLVGAIEGAVTYGIGLALGHFTGIGGR